MLDISEKPTKIYHSIVAIALLVSFKCISSHLKEKEEERKRDSIAIIANYKQRGREATFLLDKMNQKIDGKIETDVS